LAVQEINWQFPMSILKSPASSTDVKKAARILAAGKLVAFPTETVYGLGADALNEEAIELLYKVKGRPSNHPVIVHIASINDLHLWSDQISEDAIKLAKAFWPGPMTLILKKAEHINSTVTGGQTTIGLRMPNHPLALSLIEEFGSGIAAPSANKFGKLSPTSAKDVESDLGDEIDCILDGGSCQVGIESTIVDMTTATAKILRPGMITEAEIFSVLSKENQNKTDSSNQSNPRVPGSHISHYAPRATVLIKATNLIQATIAEFQHKANIGIIYFSNDVEKLKDSIGESKQLSWTNLGENPAIYARHLYSSMRNQDKNGRTLIIIEAVPESLAWSGIKDRLSRAAAIQP
jgi:L-threonylcarbamoyladenylate synthase